MQPLSRSQNSSKSNRSPDSSKGPWEKYLGKDLHPDYKKNLERQQLKQRDRLQDLIEKNLEDYDGE